MTHKPPRRVARQERESTPVLLPHAVITVTEAGGLDVTVDGTDVPPPSEGEAWTRSTFGTLIDAITEDRMITVRIEVHKSDGSVFTDIIHARRRPKPAPAETDHEDQRGKHTKNTRTRPPELIEITAEGFLPGEDVAVAVITSHTDATDAGHAHGLLDRGHIRSLPSDGADEVMLFGRISGTIRIRRLP